MTLPRVAFFKNDNLLELIGLQNTVTEAFINNANVTVTVKDENDVDVMGATWPLTMPNVAGSSGDYRVTLPDTLGFSLNENYFAEVTANAGAGLLSFWVFPFKVEVRRET